MSPPSPFIVQEHTFEGQHLREYPGALISQAEDAVLLHAKSYVPHEVHSGEVAGDLTVIGFHANGFHKEVYEPFFEALYRVLKSVHGLTIGSIWIADQAGQGTSGLLNDETITGDSHWFDHSRDVLAMVNTFRKSMKRPIVAVGHSMGATQAVAAAHYHPSLFAALVLMDAAMTLHWAPSLGAMFKFVMSKPEAFASRAEAEAYVRQSPFFKNWHPDVLERYLATGFHTQPTTAIPDASVKLLTPPASEMAGMGRPNPDHVTAAEEPITETQRRLFPDIDTEAPMTAPVYNPFGRKAYSWLSTLRPAALWVLGEGSKICRAEELVDRANLTGTGAGGSGGMAAGKVASVTVKGGHFLTMTNPQGVAEVVSGWIEPSIREWREVDAALLSALRSKTARAKKRVDPKVVAKLKRWNGKPWENQKAAKDGGRSKL